MFREKLVALPRRYKRLIQIAVDIPLVWLALWLSFYLRLGSAEVVEPFGGHAWLFAVAPLLSIPVFIRCGMYRAVMRYFGSQALMAIARAVTISALLLALAIYWYGDVPALVPRSTVLNYWWLSLVLLGGLRLLMRQYFLGGWYAVGSVLPFPARGEGLTKVAIYGAGAAGNQLAMALRMGRSLRPVAFIDDDSHLATRVIAGLPVYKPKHIDQLLAETGATEVLLAIPSASRQRRREILESLEQYPIHVRSIPDFMQLASGQVTVQDIQEVDIADLLGRDAVAPREDLFARCICDQVVMVTGAGGSIGSELCRQILTQAPRLLVLFEHSEFNLYSVHQELARYVGRKSLSVELVPILGSVRNPTRLREVMQTWRVDTVYHAAAYKHVPIVEHNVGEGVMNNVMGTLHTAQSAIACGVKHFVLISTDKAVRPTNVMGSTKRLAEMVLQALSRESAPALYGEGSGVHRVNKTRFTMVRFGNVLGSSGSVIPLFREQIARGGPVTVTHPNITRYFMTIPEAAQLVIQAGAMGQGGDVFVLDMGEPVRIVELAEKMIRLSGLSVRDEKNPKGDIAIEFTGLRPGEKLYEELLIGDNVTPTEHPMIMSAHEEHLPWEVLCQVLDELVLALERDDFERVRQVLRQRVSGYSPDGAIVDWVHLQRQRLPAPQATGRDPLERR